MAKVVVYFKLQIELRSSASDSEKGLDTGL